MIHDLTKVVVTTIAMLVASCGKAGASKFDGDRGSQSEIDSDSDAES